MLAKVYSRRSRPQTAILPISSQPASKPFSSRLTSPWMIFLVALLVRLIYITVAHSYRFHALDDHFEFGWEVGRIGRSLALGRGFADPFIPTGTGPTAWLPPLYPLIIGAIFRVFGVYTPVSGWVLLAINSVFGAATVPAIYEIAVRCFGRGEYSQRGRKIALWSAWIWALYPATMQYSVRWIWETSLTTLLSSLGAGGDLAATRDRRGVERPHRWWLGLVDLAGFVVGVDRPFQRDPAAAVPGLCRLGDCRGAGTPSCIGGGGVRRCRLPGMPRSLDVAQLAGLSHLHPLRGNLGAELWVHNGPQDNGFPRGIVVFSQPELRSYMQHG